MTDPDRVNTLPAPPITASVLAHLSNRLLEFGETVREFAIEMGTVAGQLDEQAQEIQDLKRRVRELEQRSES